MNKEEKKSIYLNALAEITKAITRFSPDFAKIFKFTESYKLFVKRLNKFFKDIEISEKIKEKLAKIYCAYGYFGWTMIPSTTEKLKKEPVSLEEADSYMLKFCKNKEMKFVFSKILENNRINVGEINESIDSFKRKKFKSCVLLLFSIIDGLLIRSQKRGNNRRSVRTARTKLENVISKDKETLYNVLGAKNTLVCIEQMYKPANDFVKNCECINRDFISHGMITRDITKTDCIKVFLLLYNVLYLLDFYNLKII